MLNSENTYTLKQGKTDVFLLVASNIRNSVKDRLT